MRQQLNVRTFSPHCSLSSSMLHAWALRKGWTCHCNSFEVFKNFIFQLMSSDPDPVEEDLLYMIKTLFFFFSVDSIFFHVHCFPGINSESNFSFLICCGVWKFSTRWFSLNSHHPAWFPRWAEHSFACSLTASDVAERQSIAPEKFEVSKG